MDPITLIQSGDAQSGGTSPLRRGSSMRRRSMVLPHHRGGSEATLPPASAVDASQPSPGCDADNVAHVRGIQPRYGATGWLSGGKDVLFLFGGCDATGAPSASMQRVQIMTAQAQQLSFVKGPSARYLHATAVHPRTVGRTFTVGGSGTAVLLEDLWEWHGDKWRELQYAGEGPGRRHSHQAVCTSCGQWLLVVGGSRAPPALAFLAEMNPAYSTIGDGLTTASSASEAQVAEEPALEMCIYNIAAGTWQMLQTSPQLSGRRLFSAHRLGTGVGGSSASSMVASFDFRSSSPTRRSGSSSLAAAAAAGVPDVDTVVVSPGTRESDAVVVLRIKEGNVVSETLLPTPVGDPSTELSYTVRATAGASKGQSTLTQGARYVNPEIAARDARIHPYPSRRAGRAVVHYSKSVDEPADYDRYGGISRSTSSLQPFGGAVVQLIEFGGAFEGDVAMMSAGAHARLMPRGTTPSSPCRGAAIVSRIATLPPLLDDDDDDDNGAAEDVERAFEEAPTEDGAMGYHQRSHSCVGEVTTSSPHQHSRATGNVPVQTACVPCRAAAPVKGQQPSPEALLAYLSNLEMSTVVDLPGSVFVFGGRDVTDGRISGALLLVNKPSMVAHVAKAPSIGSGNPPAQPSDGRRLSTRFQAICATMGSMRRRSYTGPKKVQPTAPTEATMETALCKYQRQARQEAASGRRALVDQLSEALVASGDIAPSEQARVAHDLLQHVDRCGTLTWDVHEHYHDLVEQLRPIGMASPLIADERVVACETAFYLRQSVARSQRAQRSGRGGDTTGSSSSDVVHGGSNAQYREWYHPPVVTRAEATALQKLAALPSTRPSTAGADRTAAHDQRQRRHPAPPPSAPLASTQTSAGRQLQAQLNREEQRLNSDRRRVANRSSGGAVPHTPSAPQSQPARRRRSPPRTVEQRLISSEARIAVNAPLRFYPR